MKKYQTIAIIIGVLILGIFLGWLFFGGNGESTAVDRSAVEHADETVWTCSMHPQIRQDDPGQCPICGMDLIPLKETMAGDVGPDQIQMTKAAMELANVQTTEVRMSVPYKKVTLPGKIEADERNIATITARYPGRIERLYVNFTGQEVNRGQTLASIYSPELITAQKELFEAAKIKKTSPRLFEAAKSKLKLWGLTETQIEQIRRRGEPKYYFDVVSPMGGTVTGRKVSAGDYVDEGTVMFQVVGLDKVWAVFEAYESDLPWLKVGDTVNFTVESLPGQRFSSRITFIDPVINTRTRTAQVRTELKNPERLLKPQMFAEGLVKSWLAGKEEALVIPKTAVLWTGKRAIVYVQDHSRPQPTFEFRQIQLGAEAGDTYIVEAGLREGETVAAYGVFRIDAAAQLQGKPSMMNPEGGKTSTGHDHGGMKAEDNESTTGTEAPVDDDFREQLFNVYQQYLKLKDAFVQSDLTMIKNRAQNVEAAINQTDMSLLRGSAHDLWMNVLKPMNSSLDKISTTGDLGEARKAFSTLSDNLYLTVKRLDAGKGVIYYQYCPMAIGNQGAYWLSDIEEIQNPYFGEKMLKCGETRDEL